jgi:hypothetical protein
VAYGACMTILDVWLAIVAAGVAGFLCSFVLWAATPFHRGDWTPIRDDGPMTDAVKSLRLSPGSYLFPWAATDAESRSPEFRRRFEEGPAGILVVFRRANMGVNLLLTLLSFTVAAALVAYLGTLTLPKGESFMRVFRVLGTAGVLAHTFAFLPNAIWFQATPRSVVTRLVDGLVYGLATGAVFAWLWPR